ncbi:hypothetical protein ACS5NO_27990 [Larkinella sp. GY13]|jgi:hypothetical protein|uniref:hypothetical protein n=1 Tax=Larkinella sp. GY13 TaxID=3453720 RepID=UPI003EE9B7E1
MWNTESLWFEVALVSGIFAVGNILMGHFEEQTPKLRRVGKYLLTLLLIGSLSAYAGRDVALIVLGLTLFPILYVHGYYLPRKKGINGWTGEPKSRYYDFRGWDKNVFKER